jgi:hypothetical protein
MTYGPVAGVWRDVVMIERRRQTVGLDQQWRGAKLPLILTVPGS